MRKLSRDGVLRAIIRRIAAGSSLPGDAGATTSQPSRPRSAALCYLTAATMTTMYDAARGSDIDPVAVSRALASE